MTEGYLLDTCIVGRYFEQHPQVTAKINCLPGNTLLFVSAITLGEISFGHHLTHSTDYQRREDFDRFVHNQFPPAQIVNVTRHTRNIYGDLKARLFSQFPPQSPRQNHPERCFDRVTGSELGIDENDLWIASQAVERNLVLVTCDEMARISAVAHELRDMEDWTLP
ncbi:MAG TPA: type II toxin-antitoxin system VapC family toxin [Pirellulales bacterium]|nr:type II toxin-antitoxin system VapC family toxin [Pirellulales bacterium]